MSWGTALLGGASLVGSLLGARENNRANKTNERIAASNFELDRRAQELAEKQYQDSLLGFTDPYGGSLRFEEGQGWVETRPQDVVDRRQDESLAADSFLDELMSIRRRDPSEIRRERDTAATAGFNTAYDDAMEMALIGAKRMGPSSYADTARRMAEKRGQALADILQRNASGAYSASFDELDAARDGPANLYSMFANRARGESSMPSAGTAAGQAQTAGNSAINATAGLNQPYVQPNTAWATGITQGLGSLGSMLMMQDSVNERSRTNDALIEAMSRRTVGNQL